MPDEGGDGFAIDVAGRPDISGPAAPALVRPHLSDRTDRSPIGTYQRTVKRLFDVAIAGCLLLILSPVFAFTAALILLSDGRPIFFVQDRVGKGQRLFPLFKFRTMVPGAETILASWKVEKPELWHSYLQNNFKIQNDPRLLPGGSFLRRFSVDELPQLWNVLRGDMSLVGPRPLLPSEVEHYPGGLRLYASVRPGITGSWQVSGRSCTTFDERARLDNLYLRDVTWRIDCKLLLRTLPSVLSGTGAC